MGCCGRSNPAHVVFVARLAELVSTVDPSACQIWGRRDGWEWRLVTLRGAELCPMVASTHRLADCMAAAGLVVVVNDTVITVAPG